jgi:hypothetical protein
MDHKQYSSRVLAVPVAFCILMALGCRESASASSSAIDKEAQKAAQQFAEINFTKCGDVSYATDGSQIWELSKMKVVADPENPQLAAMHEESRKRRGVDWDGAVRFECSSGRLYNYGWMNWPPGQCGYHSIHLVHQGGFWLYDTGESLEQWQKHTKSVRCEQIPR